MKKTFDLRAVLSVTTGRLLTKRISERDNGMGRNDSYWHMIEFGALYEILNWMTDDNLYTHQLPRAMQQCAPHLVRLFPELDVAESRLAELDASLGNAADPGLVVAEWIDSLGLKAEYDIPQIPMDDRSHVDPYVELVAMRSGTDGIVVVDEGPELLQEECCRCSGTGEITCSDCNGVGCEECDNSGDVFCDQCYGEGFVYY